MDSVPPAATVVISVLAERSPCSQSRNVSLYAGTSTVPLSFSMVAVEKARHAAISPSSVADDLPPSAAERNSTAARSSWKAGRTPVTPAS